MRNLKLFEEFKNLDLIDDIVDRFNRTGYLSQNSQQKLIDITENPFIIKELLDKIKQLKTFYQKIDLGYLSDATFSLLDESPYKYSIEVGWYIPTKYWSFRSQDINTKILFETDYRNESDLDKFLMSSILNSIKKFNLKSEEFNKQTREERKQSKLWIRDPRSRQNKIHDFFKELTKIQPIIRIELTHKEREAIWWIEDLREFETLPGFTSKEYSDYQNPDSFAGRIKRSPRFNRFGKFSTYNNYWLDNYTHSRARIENDEVWENPRPILTHGYLYLLFEL